MKCFVSYMRKMLPVILWAAVFMGIFVLLCGLNDVSEKVAGYALELGIIFGIDGLLVGFLRYRRHCGELERMCSMSPETLLEYPKPNDYQEQCYQELLCRLSDDRRELRVQEERKYQDAVDYYTMWAHQIKTPISAMRLLLGQEESERNRELRMELFKIEQYVLMALKYLRMEQISSDLVLKKHDLDGIIRQAVRKYAPFFIRKKLVLVYTDVNTEVLTDEKWLVFVLEQVLSNAVKYTKEGSISIYMDENEPKTLVIADTGIGISGEDLPRVFEKGYTGYNGHEDKRATGVGLYMSRQVLTKLSHTIRIESEEGVGTRVKIGLDTVNL